MLDISIKSNLADISKKLSVLAYEQIDYAEARTVTELAKLAQAAEKKALPEIFDRPTPFTVNSVAVQPARKGLPIARVYIKDIAARYLEPYESGGLHALIGKGITWFNPKDKSLLNQYGNLSKGKVKALIARPDVFVGNVKTKAGIVDGIWQRSTREPEKKIGSRSKLNRMANTSGRLKLLIRFGDAIAVKKRLKFGDRARQVVLKNINTVFGRELAKAVASARLK